MLGVVTTTITFEPPCRLEYAISFGDDGKQVGLVTYCLPVSPGKSRIVAQFTRNFAKTLHQIIPRWWEHIQTRNLVLDGDMILLNQQENFLAQKQRTESWKTAYQLPTAADRLVIEFRKWFDQYCQGQLPWGEVGITPPDISPFLPNRQEVLNRYTQHTQHCSSCRDTLKAVKRLQVGLIGYFVLVVCGVAILPDAVRLRLGLPLVVTGLLGLVVYTGLKFWLEPRFYFLDYVHAHKK